MKSKFKKFTSLSSEEKRLFVEAYIMLGIMRTAILIRPFKLLTRDLTHHANTIAISPLDAAKSAKAKRIGFAIQRAAAYTPWESLCLAQSLTAQKMLKKRSISGVFYLGVGKDKKGKAQMEAHAWTECGDIIITGGRGHKQFTVLSVFAWSEK